MVAGLANCPCPRNTSSGHEGYIDGPDGQPLEQVFVNGSTHTPLWYYRDFAGTTRALLNSSGGIDQTYNSDAWGNIAMGAGSGEYDTPLIFKNAYIDTTGLIYMQARWYDSTTGQFLSTDPQVNQTLQPFEFAGDQAVTNSDPTGKIEDVPQLIGLGAMSNETAEVAPEEVSQQETLTENPTELDKLNDTQDEELVNWQDLRARTLKFLSVGGKIRVPLSHLELDQSAQDAIRASNKAEWVHMGPRKDDGVRGPARVRHN